MILILVFLGAMPTWLQSRSWSYAPSGGLGWIVSIIIILLLLGRIGSARVNYRKGGFDEDEELFDRDGGKVADHQWLRSEGTGNDALREEGKTDQAVGEAQQVVQKVADTVTKAVEKVVEKVSD